MEPNIGNFVKSVCKIKFYVVYLPIISEIYRAYILCLKFYQIENHNTHFSLYLN